MKLLDILLEHLTEWPEGRAAISMDFDGYCNRSDSGLFGYKRAEDLRPIDEDGMWSCGQWTGFDALTEKLGGLVAEDFTAFVTREQWEAARRARLN